MPITDARYISLETFRRTGVGVPTPVWFAEARGVLYVFSAPDAGKIKRLRHSARARVAPCDLRGKLRGDWQEASAYLVDDAQEVQMAHRQLLDKYGWQMRWLDVLSRLGGRLDRRQYIRIELSR